MVRIDLDTREAARLRAILGEYLSDLSMEISSTDLMDYRERLKEKKVFIKSLLEKLELTVRA